MTRWRPLSNKGALFFSSTMPDIFNCVRLFANLPMGFMLIKLVGLNVIVFTIQNKLKKPYDYAFISLFDKFYEKQEIAARD